jgi:biotin carboxylase
MYQKIVLFLEARGHIERIAKHALQSGFLVCVASTEPEMARQKLIGIEHEEFHLSARHVENVQETCDLILARFPKESIVGVYGAVESIVPLLHHLREKIGLPYCPKEALGRTMDKFLMRKALKSAGLSDLHCEIFDLSDPIGSWKKMDRPCFLKPRHGLASLQVFQLNSQDDCIKTANQILDNTNQNNIPTWARAYISHPTDFYLEEAADGELLSLEGVASNEKYEEIGLLSRILFTENSVIEMGSSFPVIRDDYEKIIDKVRRAHSVLGIENTPTHVEFIITEQGNVEIIDFNCRLVGAHVLNSINYVTHSNFEFQLLEYAIGNKISVPAPFKNVVCSLQYFFASVKENSLDSVTFPEHENLVFQDVLTEIGKQLNSDVNQLDVVGCFIANGKNEEESLNHRREILSKIRINENGTARC